MRRLNEQTGELERFESRQEEMGAVSSAEDVASDILREYVSDFDNLQRRNNEPEELDVEKQFKKQKKEERKHKRKLNNDVDYFNKYCFNIIEEIESPKIKQDKASVSLGDFLNVEPYPDPSPDWRTFVSTRGTDPVTFTSTT